MPEKNERHHHLSPNWFSDRANNLFPPMHYDNNAVDEADIRYDVSNMRTQSLLSQKHTHKRSR